MNYWLHRISHEWEASKPLLDDGYLTVGWSAYKDTDLPSLVVRHGQSGFADFMKENGETSRSRWNLWNFLQFDEGDIVIVPLYQKNFGIYEVLEKAESVSTLKGYEFYTEYSKDKTIKDKIVIDEDGVRLADSYKTFDIGFAVRVKKIAIKPRSFASAELVSRMKIRQANACINDLSKSVLEAIDAEEEANIHDILLQSMYDNVNNVIKKYVTPDKLEKIICWYMKKRGADRVWIPAKNEANKENGADADIIAEFDDLQLTFYIQAKKHEGQTDEWAVNQIYEYYDQRKQNKLNNVCVLWAVSTAEFNESAIRLAENQGVRLIGGKEFISMLLNVGVEHIDEAFK